MSGHLYARLYNRDRDDRDAAPVALPDRADRRGDRDPALLPPHPALAADRADPTDDLTMDDDGLDLGDDLLVVS